MKDEHQCGSTEGHWEAYQNQMIKGETQIWYWLCYSFAAFPFNDLFWSNTQRPQQITKIKKKITFI